MYIRRVYILVYWPERNKEKKSKEYKVEYIRKLSVAAHEPHPILIKLHGLAVVRLRPYKFALNSILFGCRARAEVLGKVFFSLSLSQCSYIASLLELFFWTGTKKSCISLLIFHGACAQYFFSACWSPSFSLYRRLEQNEIKEIPSRAFSAYAEINRMYVQSIPRCSICGNLSHRVTRYNH